MAHAPGWIELYELLAADRQPPSALVAQCLGNHNDVGETMLHWYALEGTPEVLQKLIDLGFPVDATGHPEDVPIVSAALIGNWDNVRVLRRAGARIHGVTPCGYSYRGLVTSAGDTAPADLRGDAYTLDDLLDPNGPEDQSILTVTLSHPCITSTALQQWAKERSDLVLDNEWLLMQWMDVDWEPGTLTATQPSMATRRILHHIATATGAKVDWDFVGPPGPAH